MARALALAKVAEAEGEVPVGAVLLHNGDMLGEGWNCPISTRDPTAHAEIVALRAASQKLGNYRLPGTVMYVSLEPCLMCVGAMVHARVSRLVFGAHDPKNGAAVSLSSIPQLGRTNHYIEVTGGVREDECAELLRSFFSARRNA
jgi:tRNA(adenine34) deaminase